ncbi:hypothetical protein [Methylobacterium sp. B4]|uniref:hypothetical protein n=1 Tax=Methylobacterium sp. B4 TaxID=1938755 RepID=UPI000D76252B|nr:hypothetical protein [Methylobacterium sp. B4]PXW61384.1 hypothetical protein BY998_10885 [Methylobacterium sp. B4]
MDQRVAALEKGQELIISKLDGIAKGIADSRLESERRFGSIESRLTGLEAKLDTKASGEALAKVGGELGGRLQGVEGKISNIPDVRATITLTLTTIALCLGGVSVLAFTLFKLFGHTP